MTLALFVWLSLGAPPRPNVDVSAMQEAMSSSATTTGVAYPSAASYAHFLSARLHHHDGDHQAALDQLRLALATDESNAYLMTGLAEQYARASELDHAEAQLRRVVDQHPTYAPAQLLMGRVLFEQQKTPRAKTHLQKAIKLRPTDPDAYLVLTQLSLDQGRVDEAVKVVDALGAAIPGEPIGYHRLGLALAERGDATRAERLLLHAVERDPGDIEAWGTLARIGEATGRLPKALDSWERAIEHDPENRELLLSAGRLALRLDRRTDARAWFDRLLSLGKDPEWVVKVAFSYLTLHRLADAVEVLDGARATAGEPRLHFYAGLVHERLRAWQKADDAFGQVAQETGDLYNESRLHRALCLSAQGQHRRALELMDALTEDAPSLAGLDVANARVLERAGQAREAEVLLVRVFSHAKAPSTDLLEAVVSFYQRQDRLNDAIALFAAALAKAPRDESLLTALAIAYDKKGDWQKALEKMRVVLEVNSESARAANFVGFVMAEHGLDLNEAQKLVQRALDSKPESGAFLDSMGWVLYRRGDAEHAVDYLERAAAAAPDDVSTLEHLGDVELKLGHRTRAIDAFKQALDVITASPEASDRPGQRVEVERKLKLLTTGTVSR